MGRLQNVASERLQAVVYFSLGLSSVILITDDKKLLEEFGTVVEYKEYAKEVWKIKAGKISEIDFSLTDETPRTVNIAAISYGELPLTERAIVEEFAVSIKLLLLKLTTHMPFEQKKIEMLVKEINDLIKELVYLTKLTGEIPETLREYSAEELQKTKLNQVIKHQNLDRIIQVNAALSYVSTQAFSGAIPIIERRSLIRRNSLLGIGSAILALNNVARFIENGFSKVAFDDLITKYMSVASPLIGIKNIAQYDSARWNEGSVNVFAATKNAEKNYLKLPYFSGRLGFRETEYSIAAAIQSITSGSMLEWSLMTLTHEKLHGHVRTIINAIFYGDETLKGEEQRKYFYKRFELKLAEKLEDEKLIDSIRFVIFGYCCMTATHGSLTSKCSYKGEFEIDLPKQDGLFEKFERENRNISELFVHTMDLHYFYESRLSVYIPLIWCSWVSVLVGKNPLNSAAVNS